MFGHSFRLSSFVSYSREHRYLSEARLAGRRGSPARAAIGLFSCKRHFSLPGPLVRGTAVCPARCTWGRLATHSQRSGGLCIVEAAMARRPSDGTKTLLDHHPAWRGARHHEFILLFRRGSIAALDGRSHRIPQGRWQLPPTASVHRAILSLSGSRHLASPRLRKFGLQASRSASHALLQTACSSGCTSFSATALQTRAQPKTIMATRRPATSTSSPHQCSLLRSLSLLRGSSARGRRFQTYHCFRPVCLLAYVRRSSHTSLIS